jgi:hypothetical protein
MTTFCIAFYQSNLSTGTPRRRRTVTSSSNEISTNRWNIEAWRWWGRGGREASGQIFQIEGELFFLLIGYLLDDASSFYGKSTVHFPVTMESQRRPVLHNQRLILSAWNERKKPIYSDDYLKHALSSTLGNYRPDSLLNTYLLYLLF